MTERRRPLENDDAQGALFGGEAFAPAGPAPSWKRPADRVSRAPEAAGTPPLDGAVDVDGLPEADGSAPDAAAAADGSASHGSELRAGAGTTGADAPGAAGPASPSPFAEEIAALEQATQGRSPRAALAGPTLDDVMSRVWEGLVTGLPAACPLCHGEVVPALTGPRRGRCSSCGTTID